MEQPVWSFFFRIKVFDQFSTTRPHFWASEEGPLMEGRKRGVDFLKKVTAAEFLCLRENACLYVCVCVCMCVCLGVVIKEPPAWFPANVDRGSRSIYFSNRHMKHLYEIFFCKEGGAKHRWMRVQCAQDVVCVCVCVFIFWLLVCVWERERDPTGLIQKLYSKI